MCFKSGSTEHLVWSFLFLNSSHIGSGGFNNCSELRGPSAVLPSALGFCTTCEQMPWDLPFRWHNQAS